MARTKRRGDAGNLFPDGPPVSLMQYVLGGDILFVVGSFLSPMDNLPEDYQLCITDIAGCIRVLAHMASVSHAWNVFVRKSTGGFNQLLQRLQTRPPPRDTMDGGYRLYKFVASRIDMYPAQPREFMQILGTISANAQELMEYITISKADDPSHWMALPAAESNSLKIGCHRKIALHLIGSHVISDDFTSSPFCNEVNRRLHEHDHSAFDPDLVPINIIHRRIVGYLALHSEAQIRGVDQVPLLSSSHFYWNRRLVKALTPQGRADILHVLLRDQIIATREAGLDE
jgi:hypothetical protein